LNCYIVTLLKSSPLLASQGDSLRG